MFPIVPNMKKKEPRKVRRDKAANEVCRALRLSIQNHGGLTRAVLGYLMRWMHLSGKDCYDTPKKIDKRWH